MEGCQHGSDALPIEQAAAGDEAAFAVVMQRMAPLIGAQLSRFDGAGVEEDDLTQECLLGLLAAVRTYRPEAGAAFTTYANTCIHNRLVTVARRSGARARRERALEEQEALPAAQADPAARILEREEAAGLRERLQQRLTPLEYRVLLARVRGSAYADIAHRLGISEKSVDNAVQRLRRKLTADF